MAQPIPQLTGNARGIVQQQFGIGSAPRIEGTAPVVSTAGGFGGASGVQGAAIMNLATPAVNRALIFWTAAVAVLFIFHVGGSRFG